VIESFYRTCVSGFVERLAEHMDARLRSDQILGKVTPVMLSHGPELVVHQTGGTTDRSSLSGAEELFEVSKAAIESGDTQEFISRLEQAVQGIRGKVVQQLFRKVEESCKRSGNVVDAKGEPPSADLICQMLEQIEIEFDKNAEPILPTLICHPDHEAEFRRILSDPVTEARIQLILQRKFFDRYSL
jgi:hypothetical protein